jgi:RNA polymerase sigma-70 factor (ECF subfamily)
VDQIARLYDSNVDAVHGYIARRLGNDLANDVVAEVFEVAIGALDRFDPDLGSPRAWLFGIATNQIRRHWRSEQRRLRAWTKASRTTSVTGDPLLEVDARLDAGSEVVRVMSAVADLDADDRDLLLLIAWEGCSYAACAEILAIPVGTVRSRLHRIRAELRAATDLTPPEIREVMR